MKRIITALLLFTLITEVSADEHAPTLGDFAAKQEIITTDASPLQRFQLSDSVYETAVSPRLDDLRIFNADGHVVTMESSDDLRSWRAAGTGVLARLDYMGHSIDQNTIDCSLRGSNYLRISIPDGAAVAIKGIDAIRNQTDTVAPPPLLRTVSVSEQENSKTFLYDVGGVFPVSAVSINFVDKNTLSEVVLSSRPDGESPWRTRLAMTAYTLSLNGRIAESGFSALDSTVTDRYWKVETTEKESTLPTAPTLTLRWYPEQATFLAQGKPPFTIAYGSVAYRHTPYSGNSVRSLAGTLNVEPSNATLGAQQISGGTALLLPASPREVVEWKKWILWGLLTLALFVVLLMVKGLLAELKQG